VNRPLDKGDRPRPVVKKCDHHKKWKVEYRVDIGLDLRWSDIIKIMITQRCPRIIRMIILEIPILIHAEMSRRAWPKRVDCSGVRIFDGEG